MLPLTAGRFFISALYSGIHKVPRDGRIAIDDVARTVNIPTRERNVPIRVNCRGRRAVVARRGDLIWR